MRLIVTFVILLASSFSLYSQTAQDSIQRQIEYLSSKFKFILQTSYSNHKDSIDLVKVSDEAFRNMLRAMDNQSAYFSSEEMKKINEINAGEGKGSGLQAFFISDSLRLVSIAPHSPAEKADFRRGDILLFINNISCELKNNDEITKILNSDSGSVINIIAKRDSNLIAKKIIIDEIPISSISSSYIIPNTNIAYVGSLRFTQHADQELSDRIKELISNGAKSLILDFRGNPGGYLDQVNMFLDRFIPKDIDLTRINSSNKLYNQTFKSTDRDDFCNLPLLVLIDKTSASASEIFAGTIQDLDRGVILGERSFGKGTVQKMWNINDGSGFKLTIGEYLTPSGRLIQKDALKNPESLIDPALKLSSAADTYNNLLKAFQETGGKASVPIYKSKSGRALIGGGGVFPDYSVIQDTATILSKVQTQKGIFFEFALKYYKDNPSIFSNFDRIEKFLDKFIIDEKILEDFKQFSISKNIWNDNYYKADKENIRVLLKCNIAHIIWDNTGFYSVKSYEDKALKMALSKMPETVNISFNK